MNVFISHSDKDSALAYKLSDGLNQFGFSVWDERAIFPGDNYADIIGKALKNSQAMVVLLTPDGLSSQNVQSEINYALAEQAYSGRLIPVLANSVSIEQIPWVLRRFQVVNIDNQEQEGIKQVAEALRNAA